jgi:hypothetical protein
MGRFGGRLQAAIFLKSAPTGGNSCRSALLIQGLELKAVTITTILCNLLPKSVDGNTGRMGRAESRHLRHREPSGQPNCHC